MVFGPERDSRMTLDQGVTRTVGHYLGMSGHQDANSLASLGVHVWQWKEKGFLSANGHDRPTKADTLFVVNHYADLSESLAFVSRDLVSKLCPRSVLAFCHWAIMKRAGRDAADTFINKLITGAGLPEGDIVLYARNRLIEMQGQRKGPERAELIFKAWNGHRRGESVDHLKVTGRRLPALER